MATGEDSSLKTSFSKTVTADGSSAFPAEAGRYLFYGSMLCPFTHRALIVRTLKGLEHAIPVIIIMDHIKDERGHKSKEQRPACSKDTVNGEGTLRGLYLQADPNYDGEFSEPVLWDKKTNSIVSNDSTDIMRMFNSEFNALCKSEDHRKRNYYPPHLKKQIDELNMWIFRDISNGVYSAGLADSQEAYQQAVGNFYKSMDKVEDILSKQRYLTGSTMTEADIRLFCSLLRVDVVYAQLFKLLLKRLIDYPNMWAYVRDIYQTNGISDTVNVEHMVQGYYDCFPSLNPLGTKPVVPEMDFLASHNRKKLSKHNNRLSFWRKA